MIIYGALTSSLEYTRNKTSTSALPLKEVPLSVHALHIQYSKQIQRARGMVSRGPSIWCSSVTLALVFVPITHCQSTSIAEPEKRFLYLRQTSPYLARGGHRQHS